MNICTYVNDGCACTEGGAGHCYVPFAMPQPKLVRE